MQCPDARPEVIHKEQPMPISAHLGTRSINIREIKRRADIREVWAALGGGKLRRLRGQAFWRGGEGYSVALYPDRGAWHDFATGDGGDVIALVEAVRECGFLDAAEWLAAHTGVRLSEWIRRDHDSNLDGETDLRWARWWSIAAEAFAEWTLEDLSYCDPRRRGLTQLIGEIRRGDASLVVEYRIWRRHNPELTAAMARAGRLHDARVLRRLAHWLVRSYGQTAT